MAFSEFAKLKNIPVQNLYNWQRTHSEKITERLNAGDVKTKIISALVQEILKTKNCSILRGNAWNMRVYIMQTIGNDAIIKIQY